MPNSTRNSAPHRSSLEGSQTFIIFFATAAAAVLILLGIFVLLLLRQRVKDAARVKAEEDILKRAKRVTFVAPSDEINAPAPTAQTRNSHVSAPFSWTGNGRSGHVFGTNRTGGSTISYPTWQADVRYSLYSVIDVGDSAA